MRSSASSLYPTAKQNQIYTHIKHRTKLLHDRPESAFTVSPSWRPTYRCTVTLITVHRPPWIRKCFLYTRWYLSNSFSTLKSTSVVRESHATWGWWIKGYRMDKRLHLQPTADIPVPARHKAMASPQQPFSRLKHWHCGHLSATHYQPGFTPLSVQAVFHLSN